MGSRGDHRDSFITGVWEGDGPKASAHGNPHLSVDPRVVLSASSIRSWSCLVRICCSFRRGPRWETSVPTSLQPS